MTQSDTEQVVDGNHPSLAGPRDAAAIDPDATVLSDLEPEQRPRRRPRYSPRVLAAIALGGFAGGVARYELGLAFPNAHGTFPTTTFAINVAGSFLLALLMIFVLEIWPPTRYVRPLLGVGFCGAFTTFSTMTVGADQLISAGHTGIAVGYLLGSLAAGLAATSLGLTVGRSVLAARRRRAGRTEEAHA